MINKQKTTAVIFGFIFAVVLLELGLRIGGFVFSSIQEYRNIASLKQKGTYHILCLGESTTAVWGACSWPYQLEEILNGRDTGIKFSVINKGVVSIDTNYIMEHLEENLNKYNPDMVITMMGLNDKVDTSLYKDTVDTVLYKDVPIAIYRLVKLLRHNIKNKIREIKIHNEETIFKKAIEKNPLDKSAYIRLGRQYQINGNFDKAAEIFKKAIELDPGDYMLYFELGTCYRKLGKPEKIEEIFKKAVELNPMDPRNDVAYFELGRCCREQGKPEKAEAIFKRIIKLNPGNDVVYFELGRCYIEQGKFEKAGTIFKKAIELNPGNSNLSFELGRYYRKQLKYDKAEEMLKKSIELNPWDPRNDRAYFELGRCYKDQKKYNRAEAILKKAIEQDPKNDKAYDELAVLYETMGKYETARENHKKADEIRLQNCSLMTLNNYHKLKKVLDKRGIKLVCVQYPMRSVELLKKILEPYKDIVFVDNEKLFKDALKQGSYDEYFADACYNDFGHGTPKGNRLLAENIANVILKEWFKDKN